MGSRVSPFRLRTGRDFVVLYEDDDGIEIESDARLSPGRAIEILSPERTRRAVVWSWSLVALGSAGPIYRGACRWTRG
jgi:hypothetical protein